MTRSLLHCAWLCIPTDVRLLTYHSLCRLGRYLYGDTTFLGSQRLPFGLFMKWGSAGRASAFENEFRAMTLVQDYTTIPAPLAVDQIEIKNEACLIMTNMPGSPLSSVLKSLNARQRQNLAKEIAEVIRHLRRVRNPYPGLPFCSTIGKRLIDDRFHDHHGGPFSSEAQFNDALVSAEVPFLRHSDSHESYFAHGSFSHSNVLYKNGKISAILGWGSAGWWPEYWDYTTAYRNESKEAWLDVIDSAWKILTGLSRPYPRERYIEIRCHGENESWWN